jgi:omega-3 fatty acid desaturase (delta-15 desaturase)
MSESVPIVRGTFPSLSELRAAIPRQCFEPVWYKSWWALIKDLCIIVALFTLAYLYMPNVESPWYVFAWIAYWLAQGTMFWSLFVLGHDCGHGAFSKMRWVNDAIGVLVHTIILLPYTSFQLTHRNHHLNCGHFVKDEGYGPMDKDCPINRKARWSMAMPFLTYWLYMFGVSRHKTVHFSPYSKLFKNHRRGVWWSLAAIALVLSIGGYFVLQFSFVTVMAYYGMPVIVYGCYFMIVTFQQHNHIDMAWYGDGDWTYVKGGLASVDRSYGPLNSIVHHIGLHQIHHLFPSVPHYHLKEATGHFAAAFPHLSRRVKGVIIVSYISNVMNYIRYGDVPGDEKTFVYRDIIHRNRDHIPEKGLAD